MEENADWVATDDLICLRLAHALSFPHDLLAQIGFGLALGQGGHPMMDSAAPKAKEFRNAMRAPVGNCSVITVGAGDRARVW